MDPNKSGPLVVRVREVRKVRLSIMDKEKSELLVIGERQVRMVR